MDAQAFLERPKLHSLMVVHGDEDFLRRQVYVAIRRVALGEAGNEVSLSVHPGDKATLGEVRDELETVALFGDRRLVVVEDADPFVTQYRLALEKALPALSSGTNVLVLDVKTWMSTTNLAKAVSNTATIACKAPPAARMPQWCVQRAASDHQKQLTAPAAAVLVELVGPDMGLLDQEILKLVLYVGDRARIDVDDVDQLVGRSHVEHTWKIFDAIAAGNTAEALTLLDRALDKGEEPIRLLGAFGFQFRRLAKAYRLTGQGKPLAVALQEVGVNAYGVRDGEQQLRRLGRRRAEKLYDWLLEADMGVKGSSQLTPRMLLERLVVRLASEPAPAR